MAYRIDIANPSSTATGRACPVESAPSPAPTTAPSCEEAWRAYQEAMAVLRGPGYKRIDEVGAAAVAFVNFLKSYRALSNRRDGAPIFPFPFELAAQIELDAMRIVRGYIPTWIEQLGGRGRPKSDPRMMQCKTMALSFRRFCEANLIKDKHPVDTIKKKFGVDRTTVQEWGRAYQLKATAAEEWTMIRERFDPVLTNEECAELVAATLEECGAKYNVWRYSQGPYGKAERRRPRRGAG